MSAVEQYGVMAQLAALWVPRTVIQGVQQGVSAIQSERQNRALMPPPPPQRGIPPPIAAQPLLPPPGIPQRAVIQPSSDQELETLRQRVTQLLTRLSTRGNQIAVVSLSRVINALSSHRDGALTGLREFFQFLDGRFRGNINATIPGRFYTRIWSSFP